MIYPVTPALLPECGSTAGEWRALIRGEDEVDINNLLAMLDGVRQTSDDSWVSKCPAHDDKSPSLSIKDCGDGTLLMHCFSGCSSVSVIQSLGLKFEDLFPESDFGMPQNRKRRGQSHVAINALNRDFIVMLLAARDVVAGHRLNKEDLKRVEKAYETIRSAMHIAQ
jgi:hypothetical protein